MMAEHVYLLYQGMKWCGRDGPTKSENIIGAYSTKKKAQIVRRRMEARDGPDQHREYWEYQASLGYPTPFYRIQEMNLDKGKE